MNRSSASRRLVVVFTALPIAVSLLSPVRAADDVAQARAVAHFDRIRVQGAFTTTIVAGERRTSVVVTARPDTLARITTVVSSGTLVVGMRPGTNLADRAPTIAIALPVLRRFTNEGAGSTHISGLTGADVEIENAGAASIVASGRAARESITLDGAGKIDVSGVDARDVSVDNNGVGAIDVRASGSLSMNVNGVGTIRYAGNPAKVESHVNGIGHIGRSS